MRDKAYRFYIADSLNLAPQNKFISQRYAELIKPRKIDTRDGDTVAADVIKTLGLQFEE